MSNVAEKGIRRLASAAGQATTLATRAAGAATQAASVPAGKAIDTARSLNPIQQTPTPVDGVGTANKLLRQLGISAFTPSLGLSTDLTLPVGVGGAVAGPYTPGIGNLTVAGVSVNAVRRGEILCGFVSVGVFADFGDKSGLHVAWFNLNTLRGGLDAPLGGLIDTVLDAVRSHVKAAPIPAATYNTPINALKRALSIVPSNGVRGGVVETGPGLVLCAVYGTVKRGDVTYVFLPSIGITEAR
ncbi:hypothetical protein [Gordonia iterans]|uniref:hypothetical protein n=1 Tax=Gordonia iterans TaxID=1004901 RepID=UPI0018FEE6CE|nr:hypothetical protein [Gordonia iterans]